ncbi:MAG: hypothetical protein HY903_03965 [Deltaproteobacteria bacterium]|nr:hypothetical protein [Deltaproteobacteria bacterium]
MLRFLRANVGVVASAVLMLMAAACGKDEPAQILIFGSLARGADADAVPNDLALTIVAVDAEGKAAASQGLAAGATDFSFKVDVETDLVLELRDSAGIAAAVVVWNKAGGHRAFRSGTSDIDFGVLRTVLKRGRATSTRDPLELAGPKDSAILADGDGDGICDHSSGDVPDQDGDTAVDSADAMPFDATEIFDTDRDDVGNNADLDDDADGLSDAQETGLGTNPLVSDSDADGALDGSDAFPMDPTETADVDLDGQGNNADLDDDNDFLADAAETATDPLNPDSDADGVMDGLDTYPLRQGRFAAFDTNTMRLVRLPNGAASAALDVTSSPDNRIIVGFSDKAATAGGALKIQAVMWDGSVGLGPLNPIELPAGDGSYSAAHAVADTAVAVGEAATAGVIAAVIWDVSGPSPTAGVTLGTLPGAAASAGSAAYDIAIINDTATQAEVGVVVGESQDASGNVRAALWLVDPNTGAKLTPAAGQTNPVELEIATGDYSAAYAVGETGAIVGESGSIATGMHAHRWSVTVTAGVVSLASESMPVPGALMSAAFGLSATGYVVGEALNDGAATRAFAWELDEATPHLLDLATASSGAFGCSSMGRIAGSSSVTPHGPAVWDAEFINPVLTEQVIGADSTLLLATDGAGSAYGVSDDGVVVGSYQAKTAGGAADGDRPLIALPAPRVLTP